MTPQDKDYFENLLVKFGQSGKKETSDLVADVIARMKPTIEEAIKVNVNGKIDKLTESVKEQQEDFKDHKVVVYNHFEEDKQWKADVTPSVAVMKSMQSWASVSAYVLKTIILVGGVIGSIYAAIKWLRN
jgi:hypothetical protein